MKKIKKEEKLSKIELAGGAIIVFKDEDTDEIRVGISNDYKKDNMFYTSLEELKMNIGCIDKIKHLLT